MGELTLGPATSPWPRVFLQPQPRPRSKLDWHSSFSPVQLHRWPLPSTNHVWAAVNFLSPSNAQCPSTS